MSTQTKQNPGNPGEIPNAPLREAVLAAIEQGDTWSAICRRMDWTHQEGRGDTSRLKRTLGLRPSTTKRPGGRRTVTTVTAVRYETAVRICDAINADPVEFGL